jgi:predicted transcriptional regulator
MSTATHIGIDSVEADLKRQADLVAERFPNAPRALVDEAVREAYRELATTATVRAHLFIVTGSLAMNRIRAQGFRFRPPRRTRPTSSPQA